ncbi:MAG: helix-turn-helix domain-containing protein [Pseudonocardiaceae bacterium]|nr:helix-turn-helix domain-containing protein [Pseudonocardiaceae bacterium]
MQKDSLAAAESTKPAYPITSVGNALRLLCMLRERQQIRLSDASAQLGVAHSTAHRLLAMLVHHDFVRQERGQRVYVAGPALVEIGLAAVRKMDLRHHARPALEKLAADFGETTHLTRLEGTHVRYLDAVESEKALRVAARTGTTLPASTTASGKAMLAALHPDAVRELYDEAALPAGTHRSIADLHTLLTELEHVRERGFAVNNQESEDGVLSIAAAASTSRMPSVGALSLSAPVSRLSAARIDDAGARLYAAANDLARLVTG